MKKKFWLVLAALAAVLTVFVGFSSTRTPAYAAKSSKKVLVVYFSRRKGVYKGPLKVGNTERLARAIKKRLRPMFTRLNRRSSTQTATRRLLTVPSAKSKTAPVLL